MRPEDRQALEELKRRLLAAGVPLQEVWAFGSRVPRRLATLTSCWSSPAALKVWRTRAVASAGRWGDEAGYVVSTFDVTAEELRELPMRASPFLEAVRTEGVRV